MKKKIVSYEIKINRGSGFKFEGMKDLNVFDTEKQKDKEIAKIRAEYKLGPEDYLNISNFSSIYC